MKYRNSSSTYGFWAHGPSPLSSFAILHILMERTYSCPIIITKSNPRAHVCCIPGPSICSLDLAHGRKPVWDTLSWHLGQAEFLRRFCCNVNQSCNVNKSDYQKVREGGKKNPKQTNKKPSALFGVTVLFSPSHIFILTYSVSMPIVQQVHRHQSNYLANKEVPVNVLFAMCPCTCHTISYELVIIKLTAWPWMWLQSATIL